MNQQKTGAFLKCLRKDKGLTQEQLAERFYVSPEPSPDGKTGFHIVKDATLTTHAYDHKNKGSRMDLSILA